MSHPPELSRILIPEADLQSRIADLANQITGDFAAETPLLLIGILKGSLYFLADLSRSMGLPVEIDFVALSSYESNHSSGVIDFRLDLKSSIEGRDVLIVEDIVDTGRTLSALLETLHDRNPASLRVCTLLNKPARREREITLDYVGFEIPDAFVVGYGLDLDERYRSLRYIGVLNAD